MAVSRRAALQGVLATVGVVVLGGCRDDDPLGASPPADGDFLLPASVDPGEQMVTSEMSFVSAGFPRWVRPLPKQRWFTVSTASAGEFVAPLERAAGDPPIATERHSHLRFQVLRPSAGRFVLFIDDGRREVIITGFGPPGLAASEVIELFEKISLPFDPETDTIPGFVGPLFTISEGSFYVTARDGTALLGVNFAKLPKLAPRMAQTNPDSRHRWVDGRRITIGDAGYPSSQGMLLYEESDGLRVMGAGSAAPDVESLVRAVRRVNRPAWGEALVRHAPVVPTTR